MVTFTVWLAAVFSALSITTCKAAPTPPALGTREPYPRPVWAIAHKVLTTKAVDAAVEDGANAIEIDIQKWDHWWADHDHTEHSAGDTAENMFKHIGTKSDIGFVWLDLKEPDRECDKDTCTIEHLQNLARKHLVDNGVKVLYGFFRAEDSDAFKEIRHTLNENEAVVFSGKTADVVKSFDNEGGQIPTSHLLMDYGDVDVANGFGDCTEEDWYTCTELKKAGELRGKNIGMTFGWTADETNNDQVEKLLTKADVDGIIYGYHEDNYDDGDGPTTAIKNIRDIITKNKKTHRIATGADVPWS